MSIFHLHAQMIGRSGGRSSVAASAYRAACKLLETIVDKETGISFEITHDYTNKKGVVFSAILAPEFAPTWALDREQLWNKIQNEFDIRSNSQFTRDITLALPKELTVEKNIKLLQEFVHETLVKEGMIADVNLHNDNPDNPHAHIMLSTREIVQNGAGEYTFGNKVRHWGRNEFLVHVRRMWAGYINKHLELEGIDQEVSHLSYKERGISFIPTIKEGVGVYVDGSERVEINKQIHEYNQDKLQANPLLVLDQIRKNKPVFTKEDIAKELFIVYASDRVIENDNIVGKNVDERVGQQSLARYISALDLVMSSERVVLLSDSDLAGRKLYTTIERYELEKDFTEKLVGLKYLENNHCLGVNIEDLDKKNLIEKAKDILSFNKIDFALSKQQREVVLDVLNGGNVSIVEGLPGAGKTSSMREVVRQYKKAGYNVLGLAVSSSAARELTNSAGIKSYNITKFRYENDKFLNREFNLNLAMDYFKDKDLSDNHNKSMLSAKDVLIVDESSMVDLTEMHYIVNEVERSGAKLVLLGDRNQLPAIGVQGAINKMADIFGAHRLDEVRRQKDELHRDATVLMSEFKVSEAINLYRKTDSFRFSKDLELAKEHMARDYVAEYIDRSANSAKIAYEDAHVLSSDMVALAYTNKDIKELNHNIRNKLYDAGVIRGKEVEFNISREGVSDTIKLARGDQVVFTRNSNYFGVVNSDVGEVVGFGKNRFEKDTLKVKLEGEGRGVIEIDNDRYRGFDYGYAISVHKSQGKTYESVRGLIGEHVGFNTFNVMATRHTDKLKLYTGDDVLQSELYRKISLDSAKAKDEFDIKSDYKDQDSARYAGLNALIQKIGDTSLAVDYENNKVSIEAEKLEKYVDTRNEVIALRKSIDEWLDIERSKGRVVSFSDHKYHHELNTLVDERKQLALEIYDNFDNYKSLLTQSNINFNTIEKHAEKSEFKYFFSRKDYSGSIADIKGFREILDIRDNLNKCEQGALFEKEVKEHSIKLQEVSSRLINEFEEHKLAISLAREQLNEAMQERQQTEKFVYDGKEYINKGFKNYLGNIYRDTPSDTIKVWEGLKKDQGLDKALELVKDNPAVLGKLKGFGIGSLAISTDRLRAQENLEVIKGKFEQFELFKKDLPIQEEKLASNGLLDSRIHERELELKELDVKLPNIKVQEFVRSAFESSQSYSHENQEAVLTWSKDIAVEAKSKQFKNLIENNNDNIKQAKSNKETNLETERTSREYIKKRESVLQQYEYSRGTDDRSKLYRNIAGSLNPDLAYDILRNVSLRAVIGDKVKFVLASDNFSLAKLEQMKDALLKCAQHSISYDIKEVELITQTQNNIFADKSLKEQSLPAKEQQFVKDVIHDLLLDQKMKDKDYIFSVGDKLRVEVEAEKLGRIIVNERVKKGESTQNQISRKELIDTYDNIYKQRENRINKVLETHDIAKELSQSNMLAARIFSENFADKQMMSDSVIKGFTKQDLEQQKNIALIQADIVNNIKPDQIDHADRKFYNNQLNKENFRDKVEYIKHSINKALEPELNKHDTKTLDMTKIHSIGNQEVLKTNQKVASLQKQFTADKQKEVEIALHRQNTKDYTR